MTRRERRFVHEVAIDGNQKKAAIRAGYSAKGAAVIASRLMTRPPVRYELERSAEARMERAGLTRERVLLEYARLAFGDLGRLATWGPEGFALRSPQTLHDDDAAAIMALTAGAGGKGLRVRLHDKGFALEALARYFGLLDEPPPEAAPENSARAKLMERLMALAPPQG
jgi:phage terminase small subunit